MTKALRFQCVRVQENTDPDKGKFSEEVWFTVEDEATRDPLAPGGTTTRAMMTVIAPGPFGQYIEGKVYNVTLVRAD